MSLPFATFNFDTLEVTSAAAQEAIWKRRSDLRGLNLTSATLEWVPYEKVVVNEDFDIIEAEGMVIDVMKALQVGYYD